MILLKFTSIVLLAVYSEAVTRPGVAPLIELNDGKTIPSLGLGTWLGFTKTGDREPVEDDSVQKAVEIAIDAGYRQIDTAAIYNTETQVGAAIKNKIAEGAVSRKDLFVTSKLWNDRHAKSEVVPALKESLARLGLEYLDLYLIHWPIAQTSLSEHAGYADIDYVETWQGMMQAQAQGLVKSIGVSNFNVTQLDRLISMSRVKPAALQVEVNLNLQQAELIKFCKMHNIAVIGYTPFGSIFHSKAAKDAPPPRTDDQSLLKIADKHHKTVAQVNLRYLEAVTRPGVAPLIELNDGKTIPSLGLGTWLGFTKTGDREPVEDDSVQKAVEIAIDAGYRQIDTAAIYNTETQVGAAIKNKIAEGAVSRKDLFVTSKLWNDRHAKSEVVPALKESLARLGLEYLDLYLIHWPIAQTSLSEHAGYADIDYVETWQGMMQAQAQGLVKSIGVSNFNVTQLDRLISMSRVKPAALQVEVNLNLQQAELIKFCKMHNIAVIGYTPFGSIFHSKAAKDAPPPRTDDQSLLKIADKHHKTVAQVNLRYLIELGVIPIPKSVTKKRIEANIEVFDFQLNQKERDVLKSFDRNYRTIAVNQWKDSPYYPFNK